MLYFVRRWVYFVVCNTLFVVASFFNLKKIEIREISVVVMKAKVERESCLS